MAKKAFITGIMGQDGSYLAELLLSKGYEVHGLVHPETTPPVTWLDPLLKEPGRVPLHLHNGSLTDPARLAHLLGTVEPAEIYNLAAQSDGEESLREPETSAEINALGPVHLLEAVRRLGLKVRFFQASSAQLFGETKVSPQTETTPFQPHSPYGYSKAFAHWMCAHYREHYRLFAVNGLLYNHESPRRGEVFVTRKISLAVARILAGKQKKVVLGNLRTKRDWGFAGDFVRAMWLALQAPEPGDYVIAVGESHSVQEFASEAFAYAGLDWKEHVESDPELVRDVDIAVMRGDASKARHILGWKPEVDFKGLVRMMVDADCEREGVEKPSLKTRAGG